MSEDHGGAANVEVEFDDDVQPTEIVHCRKEING